MSVCLYLRVCLLSNERLDIESSFLVCRYTLVKFVYEGHRVKVKVTGAKIVTKYMHSRVVCLRLVCSLVLVCAIIVSTCVGHVDASKCIYLLNYG